jgi:hypothetical protein
MRNASQKSRWRTIGLIGRPCLSKRPKALRRPGGCRYSDRSHTAASGASLPSVPEKAGTEQDTAVSRKGSRQIGAWVIVSARALMVKRPLRPALPIHPGQKIDEEVTASIVVSVVPIATACKVTKVHQTRSLYLPERNIPIRPKTPVPTKAKLLGSGTGAGSLGIASKNASLCLLSHTMTPALFMNSV